MFNRPASPNRDLGGQNMKDEENNSRSKSVGKAYVCQLQSKLLQAHKMRLKPDQVCLWSQSLEKLLDSKYGKMVFHTFLKSEFSDENIEFWLKCENYKKIKLPLKRASRARKIYNRFIKAESPKEINIDQKTRERIKDNIGKHDVQCFEDAQRMVYQLMERDPYPRFLKSDMYRTLLEGTPDVAME